MINNSRKRQSSRSNSISSSSVITVKRSSTIAGSSPAGARPTTATETSSASKLTPGTKNTTGKRKPRMAKFENDVYNVNRWSQSTASSAGSHSRRLSSGPVLMSGEKGAFAAATIIPSFKDSGRSSPSDSLRKNLQRRRLSPPPSPAKRAPQVPVPVPSLFNNNTLPPVITLPSLSQAVADAGTPSPLAAATPSTSGLITPGTTASNGGDDYFTAKIKATPPSQQSSQRPRTTSSGASQNEKFGSKGQRANTSIDSSSASGATVTSPGGSSMRNFHSRGDGSNTGRSSRSRGDSGASSTGNPSKETPPRQREKRDRDKKAMLAKALQKANTAVVLDNAQNFEGAVEAYLDACRLLRQVMDRSSGEEDKKKLEAIRLTYVNRIDELRQLNKAANEARSRKSSNGKNLPARPVSEDSSESGRRSASIDSNIYDEAVIQTASVTRIVNDQSINPEARPASIVTSPKHPPPSPPRPPTEMPSTAPTLTPQTAVQKLDPPITLEIPSATSKATDEIKSTRLKIKESLTPAPLSPRFPPSSGEATASNATAAAAATTPSATTTTTSPLSPEPPSSQPPPLPDIRARSRASSTESVSWLDTIDESGSSCSDSIHSVSSRDGRARRRKHIRNASGNTEAEFDAALDAAVEAAYDDGYEPFEQADRHVGPEQVAARLRNVQIAKERVRDLEREEAIRKAKDVERQRLLQEANIPHVRQASADAGYRDAEEDDAERMLAEMTKEYILEDFNFDLNSSKVGQPRASDSSITTDGTRESSMTASGKPAAPKALSTVAEDAALTNTDLNGQPRLPPLSGLDTTSFASTIGASLGAGQPNSPQQGFPPSLPRTRPQSLAGSVRERRFSGQKSTQLKIDTNKNPAAPRAPQTSVVSGSQMENEMPAWPQSASVVPPSQPPPAVPTGPSAAQAASTVQEPSGTTLAPGTPGLSRPIASDSSTSIPPRSGSPNGAVPARPGLIRKNKSSVSLRGRTFSASSPDASDYSASTPLSTTFRRTATMPMPHSANPLLSPTPTLPNLNSITSMGADGVMSGRSMQSLLLSSDIPPPSAARSFSSSQHVPTPQHPQPTGDSALVPPVATSQTGPANSLLTPTASTSPNAPVPLEPCPSSAMLRPFWLMRTIYQTLAHPRGGYVSTKLFVPRDAWCVKGVKLKYIDDKIAACDLLSAGLGRLNRVDQLDAVAVAEELQAFESVVDQVQSMLSKKLGTDVGTSGINGMFKDANVNILGSDDGTAPTNSMGSNSSATATTPKTPISSTGKGFSWRKLRSKNSSSFIATSASSTAAPPLPADAAAIAAASSMGRDAASSVASRDSTSTGNLTMATLPMTTLPNIRFAKRDLDAVDFAGPNANYMASLARFFDSAQVLDSIARDVEDPGLRTSSTTHVALELGVRHCAEMFAFYVCRFALADMATLLDKFIKRGSEWVLV